MNGELAAGVGDAAPLLGEMVAGDSDTLGLADGLTPAVDDAGLHPASVTKITSAVVRMSQVKTPPRSDRYSLQIRWTVYWIGRQSFGRSERVDWVVARSSPLPSFRSSTGARLTFNRLRGKARPLLRIAAHIRPRASLTEVAANPTRWSFVSPLGAVGPDLDQPHVEADENAGVDGGQHVSTLAAAVHADSAGS